MRIKFLVLVLGLALLCADPVVGVVSSLNLTFPHLPSAQFCVEREAEYSRALASKYSYRELFGSAEIGAALPKFDEGWSRWSSIDVKEIPFDPVSDALTRQFEEKFMADFLAGKNVMIIPLTQTKEQNPHAYFEDGVLHLNWTTTIK